MKKIESIFRIKFEDEIVLQALILCFEFLLSRSWYTDGNNNSTVATTWLEWKIFESGIRGNHRRESGIHGNLGSQGMNPGSGIHGESGIPGNESQTRFPESESQTRFPELERVWIHDGSLDIQYYYRSPGNWVSQCQSQMGVNIGMKTDDSIPGDGQTVRRTDRSLRCKHI